MKPDRIFMEAQEYAFGFYEKSGFQVISEVSLEDDIPHAAMVMEII